MFNRYISFVLVHLIIACVIFVDGKSDMEKLEDKGREYITELDRNTEMRHREVQELFWRFVTNMTSQAEKEYQQAVLQAAVDDREAWKRTKTFEWKQFKDPILKRMFKTYNKSGYLALPQEKYELRGRLLTEIRNSYDSTRICAHNNTSKCDLGFKDVSNIMRTSQNSLERKYLCKKWFLAVGGNLRDTFSEYVEVTNEAAKLNGYRDFTEMWSDDYETFDLDVFLSIVFRDLQPFILEMHAYIRNKLSTLFKKENLNPKAPIPFHLLGLDPVFTRPFPNKSAPDMTEAMLNLSFTPKKMFQMSEDFFMSLNFSKMTDKFWKQSIFRQRRRFSMDCEPLAVNMYNKDDFRIKMCTEVNYSHWVLVHSKMAEIKYYMKYQNQPHVFQESANPAFRDAISNAIALSVLSPKYSIRVGLLTEDEDDEMFLNRLYDLAYEYFDIITLSYALLRFRNGGFNELASREDYNCFFWRLLEEVGGFEPPDDKYEDGFDPAGLSLFHQDVDAGRFFMTIVLQFQFYHGLCKFSGQYGKNDSLANCDLYNSTAAGRRISDMMKLGSSKPWPDALYAATRQKYMKADGFIEYFKPLITWLRKHNDDSDTQLGWLPSTKRFCSTEQWHKMRTRMEGPNVGVRFHKQVYLLFILIAISLGI